MKIGKSLFLSLILLTSIHFQVFSQTESGKFYLNAINFCLGSNTTNFKTDTRNGNYSTGTSYGFTPEMGLFVSNDLIAGIEVPFRTHKASDAENSTDVDKLSGIGLFVKYYLGQTNVKPYMQMGYGFGGMNKNNPSRIISGNTNFLDISTGISFFLNQKFSFDIAFKYIYTVVKPEGSATIITATGSQRQGYKLNSNDPSAHIGLSMYF
jgi:hypothetical protein